MKATLVDAANGIPGDGVRRLVVGENNQFQFFGSEDYGLGFAYATTKHGTVASD